MTPSIRKLLPPMRSLAFSALVLTISVSSSMAPLSAQGRGRSENWPVKIDGIPKERSIAFVVYTLHDSVLKLTAQLYPLADGVDRAVSLEVRADGNADGQWARVGSTRVREDSYGAPQADIKQWTAHFRVENWDASRSMRYRVVAAGAAATYEGTVRKDPVDQETIVVAAFTGNSKHDRRLKPDIVRNIRAQDPDLLFFSGDQSYDHKLHYQAWLLFGQQFGEITRDRPTVCIPDDHDVGQANIWGENGVREPIGEAGAEGGYFYSPEYVNSVQRAQTWHLPDAWDDKPIHRGIGVYYTALRIGRVDFAIIEDRKFKTGPKGLVRHNGPRPDHITDPKFDPSRVDLPDARLLGDRQLQFLHDWGRRWDGVSMKAVLSQTVFANAAHRHGRYNYRLVADLDSNGWPQHGRNKALIAIRRCFAFMIGGDQHLATVIHHGVNEWRDAGYSFCVPSIVNLYNRWWDPEEEPVSAIQGPLPKLGDYYDGFRNKVTMYAYANPDTERKNRYGGEWGARAAGYGIIRFNVKTRKIKMECWPRGVDVTAADAEQYPGWPITIDQVDNYGRQGTAFLPTLEIAGAEAPVLEVVDETYDEIVYTLRLPGNRFQPKVFRDGEYTLRLSEGGKKTVLSKVRATPKNAKVLKVSLGDG